MANEIRRRYNFNSGLIDDNPLTNSATTLTSTELASLPAVGSSEHLVLVLDPTGLGNGPEIVHVTAHTASATTATIVRGREGTSGVQHASTIYWVHVAAASDFVLVGDDNDQPSTGGLPYEGMQYVDTTNDSHQIYTGSGWADRHYGAFVAWTPTITQNGSRTITNGGSSYVKQGRLIIGRCQVTITNAGTLGNLISSSLPVTPKSSVSQTIGSFNYTTAAGTRYSGAASWVTAFSAVLFQSDSYTNVLGIDPSFATANGDVLSFNFMYEANA